MGASPAAPDRGWRRLGDCLCRRQAIAADHAGLERPYRTSRVDGQAGDRSEADLEVRGGRANAAASPLGNLIFQLAGFFLSRPLQLQGTASLDQAPSRAVATFRECGGVNVFREKGNGCFSIESRTPSISRDANSQSLRI
jgi:hypothetical protein